MDKWTRSTNQLAGYPTTQLRSKGNTEYAAVGRHGEVWQYSDTEFRAVFYNTPKRARKAQRALGIVDTHRLGDGDVIVSGTLAQLPLITPFLGLYATSGRMAAKNRKFRG
jgi:hypothetical protein